jgi:HAD superfamily hydrolase (TIGR01509 family)
MSKMNGKRGVLVFDYDGVLADTEPLHWASWKKLLAPYQIELTWEQYCRHCRGVGEDRMREAFIEMSPQAIRLPDLSPYLAARKLEVRESSLARSPIPREIQEMLQQLGDWRLGLVTSAERADIEPVLRRANIQDCFEACVFSGDVTRRKPAPDPYLVIAARMGVPTGIAFEDSDSGIASAVAAGFHVIRVDDPKSLPGIVSRITDLTP